MKNQVSSVVYYQDALIGENSVNTVLNGTAGIHDIWGGIGGNDTLSGGVTDTAFWWGEYDTGNDVIADTSNNGNDAVILYKTLFNNLYLTASNGNLYIQGNKNSSLELQNWMTENPANRIQSFILANGTDYAWNNGQGANVNLSNTIYQESNIHTLISADTGNSTLTGGLGNDVIEGGLGNDLITAGVGNDNLWGGSGGNDTLVGGSSSDTFFWGRSNGYDVITQASNRDTVNVYNIANPSGVTVQHNGANLVLQTNSGDSLTISNWQNNDMINFLFGNTQYQLTNNGWVSNTANHTTVTTPAASSGSTGSTVSNTTSSQGSDDFALLVGINNYQTDPLQGCIKDVTDVNTFLQTDSLWKGTNTTLLENSAATENNILSDVSKLSAEVKSDSNVLIYYSGHGYEDTGDLAPYDENDAISSAVMASDLNQVAQKLTTGHITLVLDSCYSGQWVDYFKSDDASSKFTIISGCGDNQSGYDLGAAGGAFTSQFVDNGLIKRQADLNGDGSITTQEAYSWAMSNTSITSLQQPMMYDGSNGKYTLA